MLDLTLGIIGLGVGRRYARAARAAGHRVIVCDLDQDRLDQVCQEIAPLDRTTDWRQLVSDDRVDAVIVASPDSLHRPMVLETLRNGKHVLCETPLALRRSEAELLVEAVQEAGVHAMAAHRLRFHPLVQRMRRELAALGPPTLVEARWLRPLRYELAGWRLDPALKRHLAIGEAVDLIDALRWLAGDLFEVTGFALRRSRPDWPVADTIVCAGRYRSGAALQLFLGIGGSGPSITEITVRGEGGTLSLDLEARQLALEGERGVQVLEALPPEQEEGEEAWLLQAFVDLLRDGKGNPCSFVEAANAVATALAIGDATAVNLPARIRPVVVEE
ncbi:MAG: Gfo/Idh/MocA family oxidoreductase [candidate division KSB1 bacterium]|nr:Gfo/Idh/MocA family oxidoreductase [candidate division KSB1 bacterium]